MGCPANKVLKGCAGAALMGDLGLAEKIVRTVRDAITIPLTVKFRLGLDDSRRNYLELGRICEANGVAAVAMHARTARQMFTGEADWTHLARLKEALADPGDRQRRRHRARGRPAHAGRDRLRRRHGRPRRHPQPVDLPADRRAPRRQPLGEATLADRRDLILDHFRMVAEREDSLFALHKLRKFTGWYTHGLPNGRKLRQAINRSPTSRPSWRPSRRSSARSWSKKPP